MPPCARDGGATRWRGRLPAVGVVESSAVPERMVRANGVDLCVETFGDPVEPAILLLISGATASMDWWDDEFCRRPAAGGRFVIRYDYRDTVSGSIASIPSRVSRGVRGGSIVRDKCRP
jgi:pimeloyl-ACP methyl ester carboxylesterase